MTDLPGWQLEVDLTGTALESAQFQFIEENEKGMITAKIENQIFKGYCSINLFNSCIDLFFNEVIPNQINNNFEYEVFETCEFERKLFWRPLIGTLTQDLRLKLIRIPKLAIQDLKAESIEILAGTSFSTMQDNSKFQVGKTYEVVLKKMHNGNFPVLVYSEE